MLKYREGWQDLFLVSTIKMRDRHSAAQQQGIAGYMGELIPPKSIISPHSPSQPGFGGEPNGGTTTIRLVAVTQAQCWRGWAVRACQANKS